MGKRFGSGYFRAKPLPYKYSNICRQLASRIRMEHPDPAGKLSANLYDIYHCCLYSEKLLLMDRGTVRNM